MASSAPNRQIAGRAAAILTTAEVASASFDLNEAWSASVTADIAFTLGSLTNVLVKFYASTDGVSWDTLYTSSGAPLVLTLTANADIAMPLPAPRGYKFLRASAQGTGTTTGSSLAIAFRYQRRGTQ